MKYAAAAFAFTGLAAAQNGTFPAPANTTSYVDVWTTLTICDVHTLTVTSCAPTVLDCPAAEHTYIATSYEYVPVTTTECPLASYTAIAAALPPTQTIYPAPTPMPAAPNSPAAAAPAGSPAAGVPSPVSPVAPAGSAGSSAMNTPTAPSATVSPYTGSAALVSGSIGAVIIGVIAALTF